jgi:hypothetical protein
MTEAEGVCARLALQNRAVFSKMAGHKGSNCHPVKKDKTYSKF